MRPLRSACPPRFFRSSSAGRLLGLGLATLVAVTASAREWTVFCLPAKHLDVGFTYLPHDALDQGYPGSVEDYQNFVTLRALFLQWATRNLAPDAQFRWFFESAWQIEQMEKFLPGKMDEIRRLVNEGRFSYNPLYTHSHSLYLTHEQMMRSLGMARELEQQGFRRSYVAVHADVPTVAWGYASLLASAGVKYFWKPTWHNSPYSRPLTHVAPAPLFRWTGPDGRKVLCFYYDSYAVMPQNIAMNYKGGMLPEAVVEDCIRRYETLADNGQWPYDAFPMYGSEGDWGVPDRANADFIARWNQSHPGVHLRMATPEQFFEYIEAKFSDRIPDGVSGGWGISYDLIEANAVRSGARVRENDRRLLAAEAFGSLASLRFGAAYPAQPFQEAWKKQILYHEHSFGMRDKTGPEGRRQYAWKNRLTEQVAGFAQSTLDASLQALVTRIPNAGEERVAVFNPLSFPISDTVELPLDSRQPAAGNTGVQVIDVGRGTTVPASFAPAEDGGAPRVRFRAQDVPGIGYRTYRIVRGAVPAPPPTSAVAVAAERRLENQFYRVTLAAAGSIASLFDKELNRELFDPASPWRGNQFIFKNDAWESASPASATITALAPGAGGATLEARFAATGAMPVLVTRYTLHEGVKRLDIENRLTKEPGRSNSNETAFYAFPFAVPGGKFHLDLPGVVARYPEDFRPETDWSIFPAQSFAAVANGDVTAILAVRESPSLEFSAMRKFFDHPAEPNLATTTIFAQPLTKQTVNSDDYDLEGGAYTFHYAITSRPGPFRAAEAVRFAAAQRPLLPVALPQRDGPLPATAALLETGSDQVVVSALKQADDGRGLIVRLWNPDGTPATAALRLPGARVTAANLTDGLERDLPQPLELRNQAVVVPVSPKQFVTLRLLADFP